MTDFARYLNIRHATTPVPAPDGSRVAFLSDITGNDQVWSVTSDQNRTDPKRGDWPRQLTFFADKVWGIHGTGAADHLIAVGDVGGNERQQLYLLSNYGGSEDGHAVRRLTTDDDAIHRFGAWSRDGRRVLLTGNARNGVDFDLYLIDVADGAQRLLHEMAGNRNVLAWSPDERFVLVEESVGPLQIELYVLDLETNETVHLTRDQPAATYGSASWTDGGIYLLSDRVHDRGAICRLDGEHGTLEVVLDAEGHPQQGAFEILAMDSAGTRAAYTYNVDGYSRLWLLDPVNGERLPIGDLPEGQIGSLQFGGEGSALFLDLMTPDRPSDIWQVDLAHGTHRQVTQSDLAGIDRSSFVSPRLIRYDSFDGLEIPAFFYLPTTPRPANGYPCILYVHGGPSSQLRPDFDVRFQYFLRRGYAILGTNVRGSTGYGRAYTALDEVEKRPNSVADLEQAVVWLQEQTEIDGDRIAIYGRSYGGYMVLAALTEYPELFAAGIDVVGIANWVTFLERTSPWRRAHREREYGSLTHDRALLERISPIHKAENITMPLLVIAGDNDPRVPLYESEQIVEQAGAVNDHVEFLHYADEGHKISKLDNRIDSFTKMAAFLDRHLREA